MPDGTGEQFSDQKGFIGQSCFGDDPNIGMVRPEVAERRTNGITARMVLNSARDLGKSDRPRRRRDVEDGAQQSVDTRGSLSGRKRFQIRQVVDSNRNTRSASCKREIMPQSKGTDVAKIVEIAET